MEHCMMRTVASDIMPCICVNERRMEWNCRARLISLQFAISCLHDFKMVPRVQYIEDIMQPPQLYITCSSTVFKSQLWFTLIATGICVFHH